MTSRGYGTTALVWLSIQSIRCDCHNLIYLFRCGSMHLQHPYESVVNPHIHFFFGGGGHFKGREWVINFETPTTAPESAGPTCLPCRATPTSALTPHPKLTGLDARPLKMGTFAHKRGAVQAQCAARCPAFRLPRWAALPACNPLPWTAFSSPPTS